MKPDGYWYYVGPSIAGDGSIERLRADNEMLRGLIDLPPGHHHVHVNKDGTITAVPMRQASIQAIVAELAATHPQNGYYCGHCGTPMNNHALPPDTYLHTADCLWVCARQAIKETP